MSDHPNAALVRKGFEAFASGDMATMDALFTDDVTWHAAGRTMLSGDFKGKEAVFGNFGRFGQEVESFNQDLHAVLADDNHAVALVDTTVTRGGETANMHQIFVFHIGGGRVTEAWVTSHDLYAADEFWSR